MPIDFIVDYQGNDSATSEVILEHLLCRPLDAGMAPVVIIKGPSGSGKTCFTLKIEDKIYEHYGLDFANYIKRCVFIRPADWGTQGLELINEDNPDTKHILTVHIDEAKFGVSADDWQKIANKGTRAFVATGRVVRPRITFIVCQLLKHADARLRETATYIFDVQRSPGAQPAITCFIPFEKIKELNNIVIKMRGLCGIVRYPDGSKETVYPVFRPSMPRKEIMSEYLSFERPDKTAELTKIFRQIGKEAAEREKGDERIVEIGQLLVENPQELELAGAWGKKGWRFAKSARKKFALDIHEVKEVEKYVSKALGVKTVKEEKSDGIANPSTEES